MGDGTAKNPYTREDVCRLIKEHGSPGRLNLSGKRFESRIDLRDCNLELIILNKANFAVHFERGTGITPTNTGAQLQGAKLNRAKLRGVSLRFAYLQKADLSNTNLKGADLSDAHLEGVRLYRAQFDNTTNFQGVSWGDYKIGEELDGKFDLAVDAYRRLKAWYTNAGIYDVAGKFFYRELEARRKIQSWKSEPHLKLWSWVLRLLCGYGEKPERVVASAAVVVLGLALIYFALGTVWEWQAFWNSLYFSAVSFTALGYGAGVNVTNDWIKGIGAAESFVGVFMMALFLVTFTRKMTR
jgi:hypothetical protein